MPISRLRLQLAAWFAVVFLIGLGAADAALFAYLRSQADQSLTHQVTAAAEGLALAVRRELVETPGDLVTASQEALAEWPSDGTGFVLYGGDAARVGERTDASVHGRVPPLAQLPAGDRTWDVPLDAEGNLRLAVFRTAAAPAFSVVAMRPTTSLREANERLAWLLALSAPVVVLLALAGGYVLARQALRPLRVMTQQIAAIDSDDLDRRLPVRRHPDELDALAEQFNHLFERLAMARARNRRFLAQAAHQIRTPLTVIRGESALGQTRPRTTEEHRDLLRRVSLAAEQMTHRVDDLFLLAQAEAGDRPSLTDQVDLDGLVLECVDLMRGRADGLGRQLELGAMDPVEVRGNETLIREGVLELLENAVRHGDATRPIGIATLNGGGGARIEVSSGGAPVAPDALAEHETTGSDRTSLGLSIVRWIANVHGGALSYRHEGNSNTFVLDLAVAPGGASPGHREA